MNDRCTMSSEGLDDIGKLLAFLDVDGESGALAKVLSDLLMPQLDAIIDDFYGRVRALDLHPHMTDQVVARLKSRQKRHWAALFASEFGSDYIKSTQQIGIRHKDVELDPKWYVAGYMRLKLAFTEIVLRADLPAVAKGKLLKVLDKYVAIDMALALSTYEMAVLD
jgi:methyl-accepting chemotaxis protein